MPEITVATLIQDKGKDFQFECVAGKEGLTRKITHIDYDRPGIALGGYFVYFQYERIQIIGMGEHSYLQSLPEQQRTEVLVKFFSYPIPCIILTRNLTPFKEILLYAEQNKIPVLCTPIPTASLVAELTSYLEDKLSPMEIIHGVLVEVYGLGVLILGESGIGKSECALELLKRGHLLVADDIVELCARPGGVLVGSGQELIRHHMEVRGLGIIDIRSLFGIGSVLDRTKIELVIRFIEWNNTADYDRSGLEEKFCELLSVRIPELVIPVRPGRDLAVLVEVAAMNQRLKNKGYYAARELNRRLIEIMAKAKNKTGQPDEKK